MTPRPGSTGRPRGGRGDFRFPLREFGLSGRPSFARRLHVRLPGRLVRAVNALTRRAAIDVLALVLCLSALGWRLVVIAREPRVVTSPRVTHLMYMRMVSLRIDDYARRFGRPAYSIDSVRAHLDSAAAHALAEVGSNPRRDSILYYWSYCNFALQVRPAYARYVRWDPRWAQPRAMSPLQSTLHETYRWPRGTGRTDRCLTGP